MSAGEQDPSCPVPAALIPLQMDQKPAGKWQPVSSCKCSTPWNCLAWNNSHHLFPPGSSAWVTLGCAVPLLSETWQAVLSCFIELFFRERQKFYFFSFFFFKGVWSRSHLQSIVWSQIESSKTFQERMSPPLAWNSVVFVVSGSLPDFSEIAEHMQLCPNSLGCRDGDSWKSHLPCLT